MPGDEDLTEAELRMRGRQDGDYSPPILAEPKGGPIPEYQPWDDVDEPEGERQQP